MVDFNSLLGLFSVHRSMSKAGLHIPVVFSNANRMMLILYLIIGRRSFSQQMVKSREIS